MAWSPNRELGVIALAITLHVCYRWIYATVMDEQLIPSSFNSSYWVDAPAPPRSVTLSKDAETETHRMHIDVTGERKDRQPFSERLKGRLDKIESGELAATRVKPKVQESTVPHDNFVIEIKEYDQSSCMGSPALTWYVKQSDSGCSPFRQLLRLAGDHQKVSRLVGQVAGNITCGELRRKPRGFVTMCPNADKCSKATCHHVAVRQENICGDSFIRPGGATWRCVPAAMVVEG